MISSLRMACSRLEKWWLRQDLAQQVFKGREESYSQREPGDRLVRYAYYADRETEAQRGMFGHRES